MADDILTTDRLTLRPVTAEDHELLLSHWTRPEVRRFLLDGVILTSEQVTAAVAESSSLWLITAPEPIGVIGLRPLEDLGQELYYSLAPESWGRGYATEAARAVVEYALGVLGLGEVLAEVDEGNRGSIAVIERLGMTPFATVPGTLGPLIRYRLG